MLAGGVPVGVTEDVISERGLTVGEETKVIGTVKGPSTEEILNLDPDFIPPSTDGGACGIDGMLTQAGIPHAYFKVENFEDYLNMLKICTDLTLLGGSVGGERNRRTGPDRRHFGEVAGESA